MGCRRSVALCLSRPSWKIFVFLFFCFVSGGAQQKTGCIGGADHDREGYKHTIHHRSEWTKRIHHQPNPRKPMDGKIEKYAVWNFLWTVLIFGFLLAADAVVATRGSGWNGVAPSGDAGCHAWPETSGQWLGLRSVGLRRTIRSLSVRRPTARAKCYVMQLQLMTSACLRIGAGRLSATRESQPRRGKIYRQFRSSCASGSYFGAHL